jgi:YfiH family protein
MEPFLYAGETEGPGLYRIAKWEERYPGLTVGFTSRLGGVSSGAYGSLNCGLHVEDRPEDVVANRRMVAGAVGVPLEYWVYGEQVHGNHVAIVTKEDQGNGTLTRDNALADTDAFITREEELVLAAMFADCVPLYFYDSTTGATGLAHAGWKGTVAGVAAETVAAMSRHFGSKPAELMAAIGPSIGKCCYQVDGRVIEHVDAVLDKVMTDSDKMHRQAFYTLSDEGKYMLDLQQVNRQIMIKAGIMPSSIELTKWCTSCNNDRFFSHRKDKGKTGRMIAWIGRRTDGLIGGI